MPTKDRSRGQIPDPGDKLQHTESKTMFIVVKILSPHRLIARREDGLAVTNGQTPYGYPPDHILITQVVWMLNHQFFTIEESS